MTPNRLEVTGIHAPAIFLSQLSTAGEATGAHADPCCREGLNSEHRLATSKPWDVSSIVLYLHSFRLRVELPSVQPQLSGQCPGSQSRKT